MPVEHPRPTPGTVEQIEADVARVLEGLVAVARVDTGKVAELVDPAARAAALAVAVHRATEAAARVRPATSALEEIADRLAWTLHVHGRLSQGEVARIMGYGKPGGGAGGRSVRAIQVRLARELERHTVSTAAALAAAASAGTLHQVAPPDLPAAVDQDAAAAARAGLYAAATTEAGAQTTPRTVEALEVLLGLWGSGAARMLAELEPRAHAAARAAHPDPTDTEEPTP